LYFVQKISESVADILMKGYCL